MIDLERRYGWWTARVWGLVLNFFSNALALFGLVGFIRDGTHFIPMMVGAVLSLTCILVLAQPSR